MRVGRLGGCPAIGVKCMAVEKVTIEITTEELAELKTYLALRQFRAKSGMSVWGLAEKLLARIVLASERE